MTKQKLKAWLVDGAAFSYPHELPVLKKTYFKPTMALPFDKRKFCSEKQWLHFYMFDHRFECLWNNPKKYLKSLKSYGGVITPDFSLYRSMPLSLQIWNTYRNRALAYWMQQEDINTVVNLRWSDERSYSFAFEGVDKGGTVAVSTLGTIKNRADRYYFQKGFNKMIEVLEPETVVCYGSAPKSIFNVYKGELVVIPSYISLVHARKGGV